MAVFVALSASAIWPFSGDEKKQKPPRLHTLLVKANDLIDQAEDMTREGDAEAALDLYRQALAELTRIAEENPDRAETQEFAPLRHKAEACAAAIDNIRFDQVNRNSRPVVLTDTTELQKKYEQKYSIAQLRKGNKQQQAEAPAPAAKEQTAPAAAPATRNGNSNLKQAKAALKEERYADAILLADKAIAENPESLNALMVKASAQWALDDLYGAKDTLTIARKAFPENPVPLCNLARLAIRGGNKKAARKYYDKARKLGGAVDAALEAALKD